MLAKAPSWFRPEYASIAIGVSLAIALGSILLGPWLIARLPADYFVRKREGHPASPRSIAQSALGAVLLLAGVAMLFLPGQGVLTILVGLSLLHFPGKRRLELKLLRQPSVNKVISKIRQRRGKPPLELGSEA